MKGSVCITALLALLCIAGAGSATTDPSFLLTATTKDFHSYFPGELANGYISTITSPRGTQNELSYLVAFMARSKGDIARPAAVPGWSAIDYRQGVSGTGAAWLNQVPLRVTTFRNYRQTLNLHDGTLTTRYVFHDHRRATSIKVVSLISEAAPHLAAVQLTITPNFDGTVELAFPLVLWAAHQPQLSLATLTGEQLPIVLQAHHLSLRPVPPATADRAPLWYPGYTQILHQRGDQHQLTLSLDGRARNGPYMAEAVAVDMSRGLRPESVTLYKGKYRLALNVRVRVKKGRSYAFTKYVALSRSGWGGDSTADLAVAKAARQRGFDALLAAQRAAWAKLWRSDIRIQGDLRAQKIVHADLYYLLANAAPSGSWGLGPCGLTTGYVGHVFWDSDSWVFPALLLLHPRRAKTMVMFRDRTLSAARRRARVAGLAGAKYPWEADPENGSEQVLYAAHRLSVGEIHVNADVAIAQWQYWLATHDRAWLHHDGWPVIRALADFWTDRASYDPTRGSYHIKDVVSVQEPFAHVDDDTFTNASASKALRIAIATAALVGAKPDPRWHKVATGLNLPFSMTGQHYLGFAAASAHGRGNGDLALLAFPSLDLPMPHSVRRNDYRIDVAFAKASHRPPTTMGLAPLAIAAAALGDQAGVTRWLRRDMAPDMLKPPFAVRTETVHNNTGYFLTGAAGFVQALVYGVTGLRIEPAGLVAAYPPVLPKHWTSITLRDITFRGRHYDIRVDRGPDGKARLRRMVR